MAFWILCRSCYHCGSHSSAEGKINCVASSNIDKPIRWEWSKQQNCSRKKANWLFWKGKEGQRNSQCCFKKLKIQIYIPRLPSLCEGLWRKCNWIRLWTWTRRREDASEMVSKKARGGMFIGRERWVLVGGNYAGRGIYNHLCRGPVREKQQAKKESQPSILSLLTDFESQFCVSARALS